MTTTEPIDWHQRARALSINGQAFIDGQYVPAASGATFDDLSPLDGRLLARVAATDTADVDRAVTAARSAFDGGTWARQHPRDRKRVLQRFAELAARYIPHFELIDYAKDSKPDAPSGTGRELALRLGNVRQPALGVPLDKVNGPGGVRGATVNGVQVHAVRVPGFVLGIEAIFGMKDQRLHLRHEAGSSAEPYVDGALLAIRKVAGHIGVLRGLDKVMEL